MQRRQMRTLVVATMTAGAFGATALPALAGNLGEGLGYGTQPGYAVANSNTPCAGHGAFGAFGKDYNLPAAPTARKRA